MKDRIRKSFIITSLVTMSTLTQVQADTLDENLDFTNTYKGINLAKGVNNGDSVNYEQTLKQTQSFVEYNYIVPKYSSGRPIVSRIGNICELDAEVTLGDYVPAGAKVMVFPAGYIPTSRYPRLSAVRETVTDGIEVMQFNYNNGALRNNLVYKKNTSLFSIHWVYTCSDDGRRP